MRYLLGTHIISDIVKPRPSETLLAWMAAQRDEDLFIASLTVAEIRRGILGKPRGKKKDAPQGLVCRAGGPTQALFAGRVLVFDDKAGLIWARLIAEGKAAGRPRSALDMIAAIASANDCAVVTDNEKDFAGLQIINPLRECSRRMTQRAFPASGLKASQPGNLDDATIGSPRLVAAEATQKRGAPWKSKKSRVSVSYSLRRPSISIRRIATISLLRLRKRDSVLEIADDNLRILIVSSMRSNHGQPSLHPASAHLHQV
ncbi:PIN domain-containing protein [Mesorhizobium sp. RMAD-H1]|uniref:PIN domain-containing protein n=1 Tax=Mesorhizobium sp. RMAD-H1 TaxID=2587065 RepID=UPI0018409FA3|nr:putative nucleic acid-binding protein [Mesorhizobium sp. RMAD-H1]